MRGLIREGRERESCVLAPRAPKFPHTCKVFDFCSCPPPRSWSHERILSVSVVSELFVPQVVSKRTHFFEPIPKKNHRPQSRLVSCFKTSVFRISEKLETKRLDINLLGTLKASLYRTQQVPTTIGSDRECSTARQLLIGELSNLTVFCSNLCPLL